jgi:hypothetical protein
MKKYKIIFILFALFAGCAKEKVVQQPIVQHSLEYLRNTNPDTLAQDAIKRDSLYFLGTYGYSIQVPGISDYESHWRDRVPLKMIEGTSDAITSKEVSELNRVADDYAKRFNIIILGQLKKR